MSAPSLFEPIALGAVELANRVIMAPMTRCRADADGVPQPMVAEYYVQRASAGLIISEATAVCKRGAGYPMMPGIYTDAQETAWKSVIAGVHEAGGKFFVQLIHTGRIGHSSVIGGAPVSASAITPAGEVMAADFSMQPFETPAALDEAGIADAVAAYADAARRAMRAGADGVEIHGANGYLIDQFLRTGSNTRDDDWGGAPAGRARFLLAVVEAVEKAVEAETGPGRVGLRLSPFNPFNDMSDRNAGITFRSTAELLARTGICYLHITEMGAEPTANGAPQQLCRDMARVFGRPTIINGGYDRERAARVIQDPVLNAAGVAFGVPFISNPDLVRRLQEGLPLAEADEATFYAGGETGYTDYPEAG
ncbi:MAG: alkene reductase [Leptospirillia bacterium]